MYKGNSDTKTLSIVFIFIFAGAIIGETASLSLLVSKFGAQILSKLYLINGFLLFLIPSFFFKNIDKCNRGNLLANLLLFFSISLVSIFIFIKLCFVFGSSLGRNVLYLLYPISYLSKTIVFITFWTLANDLCYTYEAKKTFPQIAAWGFLGGLSGALVSRLSLFFVDAELIIILWAVLYLLAFLIMKKNVRHLKVKLFQNEYIGRERKNDLSFFDNIKSVLNIKLVRLISVLYFLVFIAIFILDFLFWQLCYNWFNSTEKLAEFQFSFYLFHGIITVTTLLFFMPFLINLFGFARIFYVFPITLFCAGSVLFISSLFGFSNNEMFYLFLLIQFIRYVIFENTFSPIFQMFFTSVSMEIRGRSKTFLDGIVKPSAIIFAGLILLFFGKFVVVLVFLLIILSAMMIWVVTEIRKAYLKRIMPIVSINSSIEQIIASIGSNYDHNVISIVDDMAFSDKNDMRRLSASLLASIGSKQALNIICNLYDRETKNDIKERIASSLKNFHWFETKAFIERLLKEKNLRIRSNAVNSLNSISSYWKWRLKDRIKVLLFANNIRIQVEAAQYLWEAGGKADRQNVSAFINYLFESKNENKRSAWLYLVGKVKLNNWDNILLQNLKTSSLKVFAKSVDVIFRSSKRDLQRKTLQIVEKLNREYICETGKIISKLGNYCIPGVVSYFAIAKGRRMLFEMVHSLRKIRDIHQFNPKYYDLHKEAGDVLIRWIEKELKQVYFNAVIWYLFKKDIDESSRSKYIILEYAIEEQLTRVCEWALDTMALLEPHGIVALGRKNFDLRDIAQREGMIELIESYGVSKLRSYILPLLSFQSLEQIYKKGLNLFSFSEFPEDKLNYFLLSENKWIALCALFTFFADKPINGKPLFDIQEKIKFIGKTQSFWFNKAVAELLAIEIDNNGVTMDSFKLLEAVIFLKKTLLFNDVAAERLMGLAEALQIVSYSDGELISSINDISDHLYIVRYGSIKITIIENKIERILSIIQKGEFYGEVGLFNQMPRTASAIANKDCEIYVIKRILLRKFMDDIPEIAYKFLEIIGNKLRQNSEELSQLHAKIKKMHKSS